MVWADGLIGIHLKCENCCSMRRSNRLTYVIDMKHHENMMKHASSLEKNNGHSQNRLGIIGMSCNKWRSFEVSKCFCKTLNQYSSTSETKH